MNRFQKKILTIAAGLANIGLALSAAMVATYAWYEVNTTQISYSNPLSGDSFNAIAASSDVSLRYEVLQYDDNLKEGVSYQGDASKFKLRPYDQWIGYNHRYENAILRCEVIISDFNVSSKELNIDFTCSGAAFDGNGKNIAAVTSNVIQFKSSIVSYKTTQNGPSYKVNSYIEDETEVGSDGKYWVADAATSYSTATEYFKRQRTSTSFVKAYKETASKYHKTVTEVPYLPITGNVSVYSVVMYVECSYNTRAVEYYIGHRASTTIDLTGDITQIKFYTEDSTPGSYEKLTPNDDNPDGTPAEDYAGDYLLVNDNNPTGDYANMFDSTIESSKINGAANFTQTETLNGGNLIKANSNTQKSRLNATQVSGNSYKLQTYESTPRTFGKTPNSNSGATEYNTIKTNDSNAENTIKNNKIYVQDTALDNDENQITKTYQLGMYNNKSSAKYGYYASPSSNLYKYNLDAEPSKLVSIRVVNPKLVYGIGDVFVKPTVYATYASGGEKAVDIKDSCTFEVNGQDAASSTSTYGLHKRVNVYYSENGVTVCNFDNENENYYIDVLSSAYLVMSPEEVTIDIDSSKPDHTASLSAELINQLATPTEVTWASSNTGIATVEKTSSSTTMPTTATVTAVALGTTTVTLTVKSNNVTYTASCRIVCRDTSGGSSEVIWTKVTSAQDDWTGRYLIVYDGSSKAMDGSVTPSTSYINSLKNVEIVDNVISGEKDYYVDISKIGNSGYYSIQTASGYYLGNTASSSGAHLEYSTTTRYPNEITIATDSQSNTYSSMIAYTTDSTPASTTKQMRFNSDRFAYYSSSGGQSVVQLYKRSGGQAEIVAISYGYEDEDQTTPPTQLVGMPFNPDGMVFYGQYSNGGEVEIPASSITFTTTPASISSPNDNVTVTATYGGKSIDITGVSYVNPTLTGLTIEGELTRTNYLTSHSGFNGPGLTVYPWYNSTVKGPALTSGFTWTFSSSNNGSYSSTFPTSGSNSGTTYYVSATYTSGGTTVNANAMTSHPTIKVYNKVLSSVEITTAPTNNYSFSNNSYFNFTGGVLTATFNDGVADLVSTETVTPTRYKLCDSSSSNPDSSGTTITTSTQLTTNDNNKYLFVGYSIDNGSTFKWSTGQKITVSSSSSWTRVTSLDVLKAGGTFVMGYEATAESNTIVPLRSDGANATTSKNGYFYTGTTAGNGDSGTINVIDNPSNNYSNYEVYIAASSGNANTINIRMKTSSGNVYGASSGGSSKNTGRLYTSGNRNETNITVGIGSNGVSSLTAGVSGSYKYMTYNTSSPRYAFYNSSQTKTVFFKKPASSPSNKPFIGNLSCTQQYEINGQIDYDALARNYFDIALGRVDSGLFYDVKQRNDYVNCLARSTSFISKNYDRRHYSISYNGLRSN